MKTPSFLLCVHQLLKKTCACDFQPSLVLLAAQRRKRDYPSTYRLLQMLADRELFHHSLLIADAFASYRSWTGYLVVLIQLCVNAAFLRLLLEERIVCVEVCVFWCQSSVNACLFKAAKKTFWLAVCLFWFPSRVNNCVVRLLEKKNPVTVCGDLLVLMLPCVSTNSVVRLPRKQIGRHMATYHALTVNYLAQVWRLETGNSEFLFN